MVSDDLPDAGPLQPDAVHIVIGDLHDLLQAEHPGLVGRGQLIHGDGAQPPNKVHCGIGVVINIIITTVKLIIRVKAAHSPIAFPSSLVEPVKIRSTATTTL